MSPPFAPVLFGPVLSAPMPFIVPGVATFRHAGLVDAFVTLSFGAWLSSWVVVFPTVLGLAPLGRRLAGMLVETPAAQVR